MKNFGFHISLNNLTEPKELGYNTAQLFSKSPKKISGTSSFNTIERQILTNITNVYTHGQYVLSITKLNLDGTLNKMYIKSIVDELIFLKSIKGKGVIIHAGSSKESMNTICKNVCTYLLNIIKEKDFPMIFIENRAAAGNIVFKSVDELLFLERWIVYNELNTQVGYCFDTCHDFVSNYIEVHDKIGKMWYPKKNGNDRKRIDHNLQRLIDVIDSKRLVVHLNDSVNYTSDKHANLFTGVIPEDELIGVIKLCIKHKMPCIIERINATIEEKKKMIKLVSTLIQ